MDQTLYRLLSWTWGLPLTLAGAIVSAVLRLLGHRPRKWGWTTCFVVGKNWGGLSLGPVTLASSPSEDLLRHEFGHSVQNCRLGPFYLLVILLPSALRYWYRRWAVRAGKGRSLSPYRSIWFEAQADRLGQKYAARPVSPAQRQDAHPR